ncbi:hypothetical protein BKA62DRAFT_437834 [Auriculariales sp. MPI-PUGE-AT-0066]|nr:hypothetical protein BKA62DRAFT_437834 [Auriculariales sp. MPI-PUGE-AT-0066]
MSRAENAIRNSFPWISDSDRTPVDEPTRTMRRQLSRVFPRSSDSISRASNIAAVKARAAIHRVTSPFRGARAAKEPIAVEAFAPRLTLYRGPSEGDLSSLSHVLEILLAERGGENPRDSIAPSPTPTMPEWVEPLDVEPYHSHPYLRPVRARSSRLLPIRLSCASGFSTCPDRVQSQHLGSVDFRTAVDMVFDIEDNIFIDHVSTDLPAVPTLEPDIVGSWSESDRDSTPLSTPRSYRRPATPLAFDRLLCCQSEVSQKDWSDSGSTTSTVSVIDYHLNLPRYPLKAGKDGPRSSAKPLPFIPLQLDMTAAYTRNASIESLSRFPSPPGSPSFRERFRTVSGRQPDQTASHYTATA